MLSTLSQEFVNIISKFYKSSLQFPFSRCVVPPLTAYCDTRLQWFLWKYSLPTIISTSARSLTQTAQALSHTCDSRPKLSWYHENISVKAWPFKNNTGTLFWNQNLISFSNIISKVTNSSSSFSQILFSNLIFFSIDSN